VARFLRHPHAMSTPNMNLPETEISDSWNLDPGLNVNMKILIIEDEPVNVALLEDMLGENGYTRLQSIMDPRLALETYNTFKPDLILLDLIMPHVDGFAVLESLRDTSNEIYLPIVVLTADITEEAKRRALHCGATDFLHKPFDQTEVLLRIRNLLETRRVHQQLVSNYIEALRA
jgi:putative two-component system response regulator